MNKLDKSCLQTCLKLSDLLSKVHFSYGFPHGKRIH